jgi:hypothetical protein
MATRTEYRVEIECVDRTHETNFSTDNRRAAERRARDLAAAGYCGRIVTARGHVVNEWTVRPSVADALDEMLENVV